MKPVAGEVSGVVRGLSPGSKRTRLRSRNRRRRDPRPVLLLSGCGALLASIAIAAAASPRFVIGPGNVRVRGVTGSLAQQVSAVAGVPGHNLFRLPVNQVRQRIAGLPEVASVQVVRRWPNRVELSVSPRLTWGTLRAWDGRWYRIDRGLVPFGIEEGPLVDLPQVVWRATEDGPVTLGKQVSDPSRVDPVVRCWSWARRHPEFPIAQVILDRDGAMCLNGDNLPPVFLGAADHLDTKLETLSRLLEENPKWADSRQVKYINLVAPGAPAILPRGTKSP